MLLIGKIGNKMQLGANQVVAMRKVLGSIMSRLQDHPHCGVRTTPHCADRTHTQGLKITPQPQFPHNKF